MVFRFLWSIVEAVAIFPFKVVTCLMLLRAPNWRQPPGPVLNYLPIVGSLPLFIFGPSYKMLTKMANIYGDIYRLKLGSTNVIVIGDADLLRSAFAMDAVSGRRMPPFMDVNNRLGIIHAEGKLMRDQRALMNLVMKQMSKPGHTLHKCLLHRAAKSIELLMIKLESSGGFAIDIDELIDFTITNIFFSTLVRTVFPSHNREFKTLVESTRRCFRLNPFFSFGNFISYFARKKKHQDAQEVILERRATFRRFVEILIDRHRRQMQGKGPLGFVDVFLDTIVKLEGRDSSLYNETQLYAILDDLFTMNLEKISATVRWIMVALIRYPLVQEKIKEEMKRVIPESQVPTWEMNTMLPILGATIMEGLRFSTILPFGIPRGTVEDTTIRGYHIPANSIVLGLFWKFHRDTALWKYNPNRFLLYNHLDENFENMRTSTNLMSFSVGNRACQGEVIARITIFLILANVIRKFRIRAENMTECPNLDASVDGVLREPLYMKMRFIRRQIDLPRPSRLIGWRSRKPGLDI